VPLLADAVKVAPPVVEPFETPVFPWWVAVVPVRAVVPPAVEVEELGPPVLEPTPVAVLPFVAVFTPGALRLTLGHPAPASPSQAHTAVVRRADAVISEAQR
jgi:hypothetical protein